MKSYFSSLFECKANSENKAAAEVLSPPAESRFDVRLFFLLVVVVVVFGNEETAFFFLPTDTVLGMTVVFLPDKAFFFEEVESNLKFSRKSTVFFPVAGVALSSSSLLSSALDLIFVSLGDFRTAVFKRALGDDSTILFFFVSSGVFLDAVPYKSNFFTTRFFIGDCNDSSGVARFIGNKALLLEYSNASNVDGFAAYRFNASRLFFSSSSSLRALAKNVERTIGLFGCIFGALEVLADRG